MFPAAEATAKQGATKRRLGARGPRPRWAPQEPAKVASVAEFAATQGAARHRLRARGPRPRCTSQALTKRTTVA
eukprot:6834324-Pyramimonas_sp.AAC.1